ncbi:cytochrome bd-I oxidase subunit CydX [Rappaport israeli]|nr:cytochrome bd-I oxidase subunit CydX [Rappaport israeli]
MWYFTWILGVGFAVCVSILNALWGEFEQDRDKKLED